MDSNGQLVMRAANVGLPGDWVSETVKKFGEVVATLIVEAIENGINKDLLISALQKLEPIIFEIVESLFFKSGGPLLAIALADLPMGQELIEGDEAVKVITPDNRGGIRDRLVASIMEKMLPILIDLLIKKLI